MLDAGGPMYKISRRRKIYEFEDNQFAGPTILNKRTGSPATLQPTPFLEAVSLWAQQGRKVDENGLCIWFHEPEPILKHVIGRHYLITGYTEPKRGD